MVNMTMETLDVLMVEDDREQAALIVDTARVCQSKLRWQVVTDGEQALAFVRGQQPFVSRTRPGLMLLDLHLPRLNGVDVLRTMKQDSSLRSLPVVIMSNSREQADIDAAYELGANGYIAKPHSYEGLCSLIRFLEAFLTLPRPPEQQARSQAAPSIASIN